MSNSDTTPAEQEWLALQNCFERYEHAALLVKLVCVTLVVVAVACGVQAWLCVLVVAVLWLQEAMVRTAQQRVSERMVQVEAAISAVGPASFQAFQLHTQFESTRPGTLGLMRQYLRSALRPTVAYPYAVLLLASMCLGSWVRS